jgi:nicotinamidase-related amidase
MSRRAMSNTDDRLENYAGAFDGHLPSGAKPALLVIDVVTAYLEPGSPLYDPAFAAALTVIERLVAAARAARIAVVFTNVAYGKGGIDGGWFYRKVPSLKCFEAGSPLGRFPASLQPLEDEILVTKQYASAFFGTSLASTLRAGGIDSVLVTGFSTSGCVRASALDALQHGFIPHVVAPACGDRHAAVQDANLFDLQAKYAEVIDEAQALALIGANR